LHPGISQNRQSVIESVAYSGFNGKPKGMVSITTNIAPNVWTCRHSMPGQSKIFLPNFAFEKNQITPLPVKLYHFWLHPN
jgi:hypothetical protein